MLLAETFPTPEITRSFNADVKVTVYGLEKIVEIAELEPLSLHEIGANIWMHYIESGAKVNPQKLATHFQKQNPLLFKAVEKVIRRKAIQDIALIYADVLDDELTFTRCGKALLARSYPNSVHISHIEFNNPYKPVAESEKKFKHHQYRSLGLFTTLLKQLHFYTKQNRINKITLSAASTDQYNYFLAHGFTLEKTAFAESALQRGTTIPMECIAK